MVDFVAVWIAFSITVGLFVGVWLLIQLGTETGEWKKSFKISLIAMVITGLIMATMYSCNRSISLEKWNNGYCPTCNKAWHLIDIEKSENGFSENYFYQCPECKKIIKKGWEAMD